MVWNGGHFEFHPFHQHTVEPNFPPHQKINLRVCTSCATNFMLFSQNAQFFW